MGNVSLSNTDATADGSFEDPSDERGSSPEPPAPARAPLVKTTFKKAAVALGELWENPFVAQEGDFRYFELPAGHHYFKFTLDTSKVPFTVTGGTDQLLPKGANGKGKAISLVSSDYRLEIVHIRFDENYKGRYTRYNVIVTNEAYHDWVSWEDTQGFFDKTGRSLLKLRPS